MTPREHAPSTIPEISGSGNNPDSWLQEGVEGGFITGPSTISESGADAEQMVGSEGNESIQDQENRHESREILGLSVRTKLYVQEKAADAVNRSDSAWAKVRNAVGSPLRKAREFRKTLAENSLERRQERLDNKHGKRTEKYESRKDRLQAKVDAQRTREQAIVDSTSSSRLQERRRAKYDAKHEKRQAKIDAKLQKHEDKIEGKRSKRQDKITAYEKGKVEARRGAHEKSTTTAQDRLDQAGARSAERQQTIEQHRQDAIYSKELALARKALRHELREKDGATRREAREELDEIFKNTDPAVLRDLGRKFVDMRGAERSLQDSMSVDQKLAKQEQRTEASLGKARQLQESLPGDIAANESQQTDLTKYAEALHARAAQAREANGPESVEYTSLVRQKQQAEAQLAKLQRKKIDMEATLQRLPDSIARFHTRTQELGEQRKAQRQTIGSERVDAAVARGNYRTSVGNILTPKQTNEQEK